MSFTDRFPLTVRIREVGKVYYPTLRAFMDEWKISYNRLCHYVYTGEELEVLNKETKKSRKMTIELPADGSWECVVKYEQKNNTAKRYQIRKCI